MSPFHFRLGRVLDWYRKQVALEESRVHACTAAVVAVVAQIARIQAELMTMQKQLVGSRDTQAADLVAMELHKLRVKREEHRLGEELKRRQNALQTQRMVLEAARLRFRLLEKLRDRRLSEYTVAADQELEELAADAFRAASYRQKHTA